MKDGSLQINPHPDGNNFWEEDKMNKSNSSKIHVTVFYVAWNGEGSKSYFGIFESKEDAQEMIWEERRQYGNRFHKPRVTEWRVTVSKSGDPIIIAPAAPPHYNPEGKLVANVPFRSRDFKQDNRLMPSGISIVQGGKLDNEPCSTSSWNNARRALLEYYQKYSNNVG